MEHLPGHGQDVYVYTIETQFGVPDPRTGPKFHRLEITSIRSKKFPLLGQVIGVQWKGNDLGLGIVQRLSSDASVRAAVMHGRDVKIKVSPDRNCWLVSSYYVEGPDTLGNVLSAEQVALL